MNSHPVACFQKCLGFSLHALLVVLPRASGLRFLLNGISSLRIWFNQFGTFRIELREKDFDVPGAFLHCAVHNKNTQMLEWLTVLFTKAGANKAFRLTSVASSFAQVENGGSERAEPRFASALP